MPDDGRDQVEPPAIDPALLAALTTFIDLGDQLDPVSALCDVPHKPKTLPSLGLGCSGGPPGSMGPNGAKEWFDA